jgi:hypothetical protein
MEGMKAPFVAMAALTLACRPSAEPAAAEARAQEPASNGRPEGFAVVELFTSEGCSSCPPADALLGDLVQSGGGALYALAFHVDYWDELGWKDRFASAANTERQRAYARSFAERGLYTPQMIVNGTDEFTGSDRSRAHTTIAHALGRPAPVSLSIDVLPTERSSVSIAYHAQGAPGGAVLNVAVVQRTTSSQVKAGENAGRVLHHTNVVEAFVATPLATSEGQTKPVVVPIPTTLRRQDGEVIAYVQSPDGTGGMPIVGAARSILPP